MTDEEKGYITCDCGGDSWRANQPDVYRPQAVDVTPVLFDGPGKLGGGPSDPHQRSIPVTILRLTCTACGKARHVRMDSRIVAGAMVDVD